MQLPGPTLGPALGSAELQADAPHLGAQCTPHTHNPAVWAAGRTLGSPSRPGRGPDSWFSMVTPCPTGSETLMKGGHAGVPGTDPSPGRGTVLQGGLQLSAEARHARRLLTLGDPYSREGHPGASEEPPLPSGMCRLESRGGNAPHELSSHQPGTWFWDAFHEAPQRVPTGVLVAPTGDSVLALPFFPAVAPRSHPRIGHLHTSLCIWG